MDPKEITEDIDTGQNVASFEYYTGIRVAQERGLKQSTNVDEGNFMVCCGDVMFTVQSVEYPHILRRVF